MLKSGSKIDRGYATVSDEEGVNYREIADTMTEIGFPMNHSSVRNYILRAMKKFGEAFIEKCGMDAGECSLDEIIKSPSFQNGIADILHTLECDQRDNAA